MRTLRAENDPFSPFVRFLGQQSLPAVVEATNAKAATLMHPHQQFVQPWTPLTCKELVCWLSLLFYMANHIEVRRHEYWRGFESVLP